ncbi:YciI family protein [Peribacillus sp. YIM B13472]|uniref:YciI family protein n=1 Tax=Peribacillus sp. YIM B13472 TaxID=3366297 RepID=UPI00366AC1E7
MRPRHIEYLNELDHKGKVFARGPFADGTGGLVVYVADAFEEALSLAVKYPHVAMSLRSLVGWSLRSGRSCGKMAGDLIMIRMSLQI